MKYSLGKICNFTKGPIGITKAIPGDFPMVTLAEARKSHNEFHFDTKAVIVPLVSSTGHGHASMKRVHYQEGKFTVGSILCVVEPKDSNFLHPKFLHIYLSYFKDQLLVPLMKGAANVSLSIKSIKTVEIEVPSLEKQLKLIELEGQLRKELDELTTNFQNQLTDLQHLRQSILQTAIQGKLVPQNPNDEPADQLLQRIREEKARLIAEKKIKKEKPLPEILEEEKPFDLPKGWVWCRLRTLAKYVVDCPHSTPKFQLFGKNCLDTTCMRQGEIIYEKLRKVSVEDFEYRQKRLVPKAGDIVYSREGTIGLTVIVPDNFEFCLGQRVMIFRPFKEVLSKYFRFALVSKVFVNQWESKLTGATSKHVNIKDLKQMLIPLPPLPEQTRIVAKVEALLKVVEKLEKQVAAQQADVERLMQGVLQEAFG